MRFQYVVSTQSECYAAQKQKTGSVVRVIEVAIVVSGKFRPELQASTLSLTAYSYSLSDIHKAQNNNNA